MSFMTVNGFTYICQECGSYDSETLETPENLWLGEQELLKQSHIKDALGEPATEMNQMIFLVCLCDSCFADYAVQNKDKLIKTQKTIRKCEKINDQAEAAALKMVAHIDASLSSDHAVKLINTKLAEASKFKPNGKKQRKQVLSAWVDEIATIINPDGKEKEIAPELIGLHNEVNKLSEEIEEALYIFIPTTIEQMAEVYFWRSMEFMNKGPIIMDVPVAAVEFPEDDEYIEERIWMAEEITCPNIDEIINDAIHRKLDQLRNDLRNKFKNALQDNKNDPDSNG